MLTVYLCDDNAETLRSYSEFITLTASKHDVDITLSTFESGEALLFHLTDNPSEPDIIYLDILMGEKNGIETAREIRALGSHAQIIFLTTTEDYVFDAFDVFPVQYLLKDATSRAKFEEVFLRALELADKRGADTFIAESGRTQRIIPIHEIAYFEIRKRIVTVHYGGGETFDFYETIHDLESRLADRNFIRIHRSFLVNAAYISRFHSHGITLKTGEVVPLGVTYAASAKEAFSRYITAFNIYR